MQKCISSWFRQPTIANLRPHQRRHQHPPTPNAGDKQVFALPLDAIAAIEGTGLQVNDQVSVSIIYTAADIDKAPPALQQLMKRQPDASLQMMETIIKSATIVELNSTSVKLKVTADEEAKMSDAIRAKLKLYYRR